MGAAAAGGVGEELQFVPQFCPKVEPERVAEHFAFLPVAGAILHTVVVVVEIGVETDVHEVGWAQGGVEPDAGVAGGADIEGLREGDDAAEAVAVGDVGEGASVVAVGVVPSGEAYGAEVVEVAFPAEFEVVGIAIA